MKININIDERYKELEITINSGRMSEELLAAHDFFRAGKSCIINFNRIQSLKSDIDGQVYSHDGKQREGDRIKAVRAICKKEAGGMSVRENKSVVVRLGYLALINFAVSVIVISVVGWFVGDASRDTAGLLSLGRDGLSYRSLAQVFLFALLTASIKEVLFSEFLAKRLLLFWRTVIMIVLAFVLTIFFSVVFRWIPIDSWEAWLNFFISITANFAACILFMVMKTKLEDKKYSTLPSDLCRRHNTTKAIKLLLKMGKEIELPSGSASAKEIGNYFAEDMVESIHSSEPNLETVFIKLTGRGLV